MGRLRAKYFCPYVQAQKGRGWSHLQSYDSYGNKREQNQLGDVSNFDATYDPAIQDSLRSIRTKRLQAFDVTITATS